MMEATKYIIASADHSIGKITLNRPEVHNALHINMIREISNILDTYNKQEHLRIILFDSLGENFSAGADLKWMKSGIDQPAEQLEQESKELALLFHKIYFSNKIIITKIHGKVIGGANGIVAASDIVIATTSASFAFTEVKLGLIPATIAPYVYQKSGNRSKEWMLTGRKITAEEALNGNLVDFIVDKEDLNTKTEEITRSVLSGGPNACKGIKELFYSGKLSENPNNLVEFTSKMIAEYRTSQEGQKGQKAFFDKQKPEWSNES